MRTRVKTASRSPDIQFLQKMGTALFLMVLITGAVTIFGAASSQQPGFAWLATQSAEAN